MNRLWVRISLTFVGIIFFLICLPVTLGVARNAFGERDASHVERDAPSFVDTVAFEQNPGKAALQLTLRILVVTAVIGSIIGAITARSLAAPLEKLAQAAQAIGAQDLSRRVEVRGSDEVQAVAQAFNDMAADLEQAEQLRSNLLADVAHELRTPLSVVQGNLRAILDGVYELDQAEIARLYEQTRHLTRLVNDLRELAQAEARQLPLSLATLDVSAWVQQTAANFAPIAEEQGIRLQVEIQGHVSHLRADKARLTQGLHNLLYNAVQHTPAGGAITVQVAHQHDELRLRVRDTGAGIALQDLDHVFDRFYRADRSRSRDGGGTGLGLAIVRAIVEVHGGKVTVESEGPGKGSVFTIRLPCET
ncbi:MAG: HAMP domain-containing protein [Delftia sp.]|nr:HAMP domain-containing protein [Delftia sp.]